MQVIPKLKRLNKNFIKQYLTALGIEDVAHYLKGDWRSDPFAYPNIEEAATTLYEYKLSHSQDDQKIGIVIDSDCDGYCSAAIVSMLLRSIGVPNFKVFNHTGKQHGLHNVLNDVLEADLDLLFVPDGGTNDVDECRELKEHGVTVIILDHHLSEKDNPYAIIVNPHLGKNLDTAISGTGVADLFCDVYYHLYENMSWDETGSHSDIVAVSLVSDVCDLSSPQNRYFMRCGLEEVGNEFLEYAYDKCCKTRGVNPEGIAWGIAPLANALARSDDQDSKLLFYKALIGDVDYEEALKQIRKVKRLQDEAVKAVVDEIEPNIDHSHKAIIEFSDASHKSYLGLIANKFCGKTNKPTFMLRELNPTTWSGSMRSPIPLATKINESGLATAQGHESACGITIKKSNFKRFQRWLDELDLSDKPPVPVTACVEPKDITIDLCQQIVDWKQLWGKGVEAPTFMLSVDVSRDNIFVYQKRTTTIKLDLDGLGCLKFFAKPEDVDAFQSGDVLHIDMIVGNLNVNEYNGFVSPQCEIIEYEITKPKEDNTNWEDLF